MKTASFVTPFVQVYEDGRRSRFVELSYALGPNLQLLAVALNSKPLFPCNW